MDNEKDKTATSSMDTSFFINELARMDAAHERFRENTARRLVILEERTKGTPDDDVSKMMGTVLLVLIGLQLLPIILDMIRSWKSSSSSPLSD
jgi:hypothetical protein